MFELTGAVAAVSWSQATPSIGELAGASENCIRVFSHDSEKSTGSFCWSQNAVLVQSTKVEAIERTGSGNGIIAGGIEVVLWKRRSKSWEIAWKFKGDHPQNLVSSTWYIEGLSVTATYWSKLHIEGSDEASNCVLICYSDGKSEYAKVELCHPQPILMIRWRPQTGRQSVRDVKHSPRHMLLTCCLDGTVRLWFEIDNGKVRKVAKEVNEHRTMRRSFCVAAVIEINQALNGTLGKDIFLGWAIQMGGIFKTSEGANQFFSKEGYEHDRAGKCKWLIGFGPGLLLHSGPSTVLMTSPPCSFPELRHGRDKNYKALACDISIQLILPVLKTDYFFIKLLS